MELTEKKLVDLGACESGIRAFREQGERDVLKILAKLREESRHDWFMWLASRMMTHRQRVQWAVFCAEQVIDVFEREYPQDARPRRAIDAAKTWVENPTEDNAAAAASADVAATSAGYAATAAIYVSVAAGDAAAAAGYAAAAAAGYVAAAADGYAAAAAAGYVASYAATAAAANAAGSAATAARQKMNRTCEDEAVRILKNTHSNTSIS